jgi:hypothetical protein
MLDIGARTFRQLLLAMDSAERLTKVTRGALHDAGQLATS